MVPVHKVQVYVRAVSVLYGCACVRVRVFVYIASALWVRGAGVSACICMKTWDNCTTE